MVKAESRDRNTPTALLRSRPLPRVITSAHHALVFFPRPNGTVVLRTVLLSCGDALRTLQIHIASCRRPGIFRFFFKLHLSTSSRYTTHRHAGMRGRTKASIRWVAWKLLITSEQVPILVRTILRNYRHRTVHTKRLSIYSKFA